MADGSTEQRRGSIELIRFTLTVPKGTLTVATTPAAPKLTIYDPQGAAVSGLENVDVTDYDTAAQAEVEFRYALDTDIVAIPDPAVGTKSRYTAKLTAYVQWSGADDPHKEIVVGIIDIIHSLD